MLTSARNTASIARGRILSLPVAAGREIFEGSLVVLDANGYAQPAEKEESLTAAGRAETYADNSKGEAGDITVRVLRGAFVWDNDPTAANKVTQAHVMKPCYILDDCTVTALATGSSQAGKVLGVTDEGVVVETV
jgi:hypothetical protein|nr:MAG TPA: hypothetical protein [Caudoviricetes sp.]